ncbi:MAG: hypothetical protein K2W82_07100 [Candidatus Obscuribacterales bacterium]|nr:hypothetical protein [Candidatus Obscuribacterales bacterium]
MIAKKAAQLIGLFFLAAVSLQPTLAQSVKGWRLQQENPHTGFWDIYLAPVGLVAVNAKLHCTLVNKAPQWNVIMYNDRTKVYFMSSLAEWGGSALKNESAHAKQKYGHAQGVLVEKPPKKIKDGKILGYKVSQYLTDNLASSGLKKVEFWITPDIQPPQQLKDMLSKIYGVGMSKMSGLPLKVSYIDENGKRTPVFNTLKVTPAQIQLQSFAYPSSYKRVDTEIAVLMDEKGREAMASIMDDIGDSGAGEDIDSLLGTNKKAGSNYKSPYYTDESLPAENDANSAATGAGQKSSGNWFVDVWQAICDWFANLGKS